MGRTPLRCVLRRSLIMRKVWAGNWCLDCSVLYYNRIKRRIEYLKVKKTGWDRWNTWDKLITAGVLAFSCDPRAEQLISFNQSSQWEKRDGPKSSPIRDHWGGGMGYGPLFVQFMPISCVVQFPKLSSSRNMWWRVSNTNALS